MNFLRVLLGLLVLGLLPATAQADTVNVGASGTCDGPMGGGDNARVILDTHAPESAAVIAPSGTGAAAGLAQLAVGLATDGNPDPAVGNPCPGPRRDWIEADASVDGTGAQLCWDGALRTDFGCPQMA